MNVLVSVVSTVIPVFNRAALLREAVHSVLDQTYRPIEIIIVDDESTDDTPECIRSLVAAYPEIVRSARQKNAGPGVARETGRQMAQGEFIQYLDSDDILLPEKFQRQVAALRNNRDTGVAYCKTYEVRMGDPLGGPPSARTGGVFSELFPHLLTGRIWQTSTPLIRRSLSDRVGPWLSQRQEEDWEYDSRLATAGARLVWIDEFLCAHRHHQGERAGGNSLGDPQKMRWRATTQSLLFERAVNCGVTSEQPQMQQFSRSLFLLSRQCGASGLREESARLFHLAKNAAGEHRAAGLDFRAYQGLTRIVGWKLAGWIACKLDQFRRKRT